MCAFRTGMRVFVLASVVFASAGAYSADDEKADKKDGDEPGVSGKVIIVGPDGRTREIDLARELLGQIEKRVKGRFRVTLPDGVIEKLEAGDDDANKLRREIRIVRQEAGGKFMIGVAGAPVSDVLRAQLNLGEDVGLVVARVFPDSPAEKAGLKQHDVITAAGDRKVFALEGLAKVVQEAGKDRRKLSLSIIRGGKKMSLAVTPEERKNELGIDLPNMRKLPIENKEIRELIEKALKEGKLGRVQIEKLIPEQARQELRIIRGSDQELKKQMEELNHRVKELEEAVRKLQK